jgi:hypothetical protein
MDEEEDFSPVLEIGPPAFCRLRRLHSLDIIAWISDLDGSLGGIPEAEVHFRRLPYVEYPDLQTNAPGQTMGYLTQKNANQLKTLWQSTLQCVYQEDIPNVTHLPLTIAFGDGEGVFEGEDASEIWWDGTPDACFARNERTKAKNDDSGRFWQLEPHKSWPARREIWNDYPLYKEGP